MPPRTKARWELDFEKLFIGAFGALIGVIGWLFVGIYIQRQAKARAAREAARVVYFELVSNHLDVYMGLEYGAFSPLSRTSFDRLLPDLAGWLPIEELQAVSVAYMGHAAYEQAARATEIPAAVRRQSLLGIHDAHRTAVRLLSARAFTTAELAKMKEHLRPDQIQLMDAADEGATDEAATANRSRAATHA
jgi:23S rRNA maturation mini-RNase III